MKIIQKTAEIGNKTLSLEVGRVAGQANGAVLARYGDTMVLATVVRSKPREDLDYFPLQVEFVERLYAGGRIKGSRWVKREGRPSEEATLTARLIDRSIRPLFPEGYKNEVQVIITVLSVDAENDPDILGLCATSAALAISDIPWDGPVGSMRVGFVSKNGSGDFVANPTYQDLEYSDLDLVVSSNKKALIMIEGGVKEVPEETILKGIDFAQKEIGKVISLIEDLQKEVGKKKQEFVKEEIEAELVAQVKKEAKDKVKEIVDLMISEKEESRAIREEIELALAEKNEEKKTKISKILDKLIKEQIRDQILEKGKRLDGRKLTEIRPITVEASVLPRTHGSAIFTRGNTQALTVTTLGPSSLGQLIEGMEGEETKRYIHHYYMPPFSVGETGRVGFPSRREIGHGALAARALEPVLPSEEEFPYAINVVSEIVSSNGSTSMASTCGSTLSLMDAGVPIKAPVSGIAMGMISKGDKIAILSDIMGVEDFNGDMDFKVTGTKKGVTAIQMDVKATTLTLPVLEKILKQAKDGRFFILEKMLSVLPKSRTKVSKYAPKIETLHIPVEKIGEVIGPGGKVIKNIIAETGANVDIEDDGTVSISSPDKESVKKAMDWVEGLVREVEVNEIFEEGIVRRIQPFGAFVEILPGKDGLVHVSKMSTEYVEDPNDVVKEGQKVRVKVVEVDDLGRINLSMIFDSQKQDNSENNSTRDPREDQKPSYKKDKFSRNPRR